MITTILAPLAMILSTAVFADGPIITPRPLPTHLPPIIVLRPDLKVVRVEGITQPANYPIYPNHFFVGSTLSWRITVKNVGTAESPANRLRTKVLKSNDLMNEDPLASNIPGYITDLDVPALNPGTQAEFEVRQQLHVPTMWTLIAKVDSLGAITEADETNNVERDYTDYAIETRFQDVEATISIHDKGSVAFPTIIELCAINRGNLPFFGSKMMYRHLNPQEAPHKDYHLDVPSLEPGKEFCIQFKKTYTIKGKRTLRLWVDSEEKHPDDNRANNYISREYYIPQYPNNG